jgi:hypothetical protein
VLAAKSIRRDGRREERTSSGVGKARAQYQWGCRVSRKSDGCLPRSQRWTRLDDQTRVVVAEGPRLGEGEERVERVRRGDAEQPESAERRAGPAVAEAAAATAGGGGGRELDPDPGGGFL